jgi:hypothetical protein
MSGLISADQILIVLNAVFLVPAAILGILGTYAFFRLFGTIVRSPGV